MTKPRIAVCKQNWKIHQNTVYWSNLRVAQSKGLQFYQTRSNAIILYNTLPTVCIEKVVTRKSGEELCSKTYQSPTLPQRIAALEPNLHYGARTPQALTRERPSTIPASTEEPVGVERTTQVVAVKLISGSKDCSIQLSKSKITSARKQSKN